jgi:arabinogalactan endo-1,4-beta-galactosidase
MYRILLLSVIMSSALTACKKPDPRPIPNPRPALVGADLSMLPEVRKSTLEWYNSKGQEEDMLRTLLHAGANLVRLRLWHKPAAGADLEQVQQLCRELKSLGIKTMISVHYSDTWADPAQQTKPEAWKVLKGKNLEDSVYAYTRRVMLSLQPDYIQIGNEINGGLLWPDGSSSDTGSMLSLLRAGIRAVRSTDQKTQIILHLAMTEGAEALPESWRGLDYDLIGLSYYPMWHGKDLAVLKNRLAFMVKQYRKPVFIAETAYPFTLGWNDQTHNVLGLQEQLLPQFPASPEGQRDFLWTLRNLILAVEGGLGFCYWGTEFTAHKGNTALDGSSWENQALWDFEGHALPAMDAFR